jgi:hypothetical protein
MSVHDGLKEIIISRKLLKEFDPRDSLWLHEMRHLNSKANNIRTVYFYMKDGGPFPDNYLYYSTIFSFDEIRAHQTELTVKTLHLNGTKREILAHAQEAFETAMNGYVLAGRSIDILNQIIAKNTAHLDGREVVTQNPSDAPSPATYADLVKLVDEARVTQVQFEWSAYLLIQTLLKNGEKMNPKEIQDATQTLIDQLRFINGKQNAQELSQVFGKSYPIE